MPVTTALSARSAVGRLSQLGQGVSTETTVPIACAAFMWMKRQATVRQTAAELWNPLESGYAKAASGQSFTGVDAVGNSARIEAQQMTTP